MNNFITKYSADLNKYNKALSKEYAESFAAEMNKFILTTLPDYKLSDNVMLGETKTIAEYRKLLIEIEQDYNDIFSYDFEALKSQPDVLQDFESQKLQNKIDTMISKIHYLEREKVKLETILELKESVKYIPEAKSMYDALCSSEIALSEAHLDVLQSEENVNNSIKQFEDNFLIDEKTSLATYPFDKLIDDSKRDINKAIGYSQSAQGNARYSFISSIRNTVKHSIQSISASVATLTQSYYQTTVNNLIKTYKEADKLLNELDTTVMKGINSIDKDALEETVNDIQMAAIDFSGGILLAQISSEFTEDIYAIKAKTTSFLANTMLNIANAEKQYLLNGSKCLKAYERADTKLHDKRESIKQIVSTLDDQSITPYMPKAYSPSADLSDAATAIPIEPVQFEEQKQLNNIVNELKNMFTELKETLTEAKDTALFATYQKMMDTSHKLLKESYDAKQTSIKAFENFDKYIDRYRKPENRIYSRAEQKEAIESLVGIGQSITAKDFELPGSAYASISSNPQLTKAIDNLYNLACQKLKKDFIPGSYTWNSDGKVCVNKLEIPTKDEFLKSFCTRDTKDKSYSFDFTKMPLTLRAKSLYAPDDKEQLSSIGTIFTRLEVDLENLKLNKIGQIYKGMDRKSDDIVLHSISFNSLEEMNQMLLNDITIDYADGLVNKEFEGEQEIIANALEELENPSKDQTELD